MITSAMATLTMSRPATLSLFLLWFAVWFGGLLWVAFHDKGVTAPADKRSTWSFARSILVTLGMLAVVGVVMFGAIVLAMAIFPLREGERPVIW